MVKRFCDTEIWQKDWFLNLSDKQKLLTKFIYDNCDCAGIYEISWRMLKVFFSNTITKEDFEAIKQIKFIDENTIFVEDFVNFQCSVKSINDLNPNNNAHKGVIKRLEKYNLFQAPNEPLTSPSLGAHSGAQEKEKEKDKEKDISSSLVLSSSLNGQKFYGKYNNVCLTAEQYNRLQVLCMSPKLLNELVDSLSENIEEGKEKPYRADFPNAHFIRIEKYFEYRRKNPEKFNPKLNNKENKADIARENMRLADKWLQKYNEDG